MAVNINGTVSVNTDQIVQGAGKILLNGVDLGSFRDGVTVNYSETVSTTRSDYYPGEIDAERTGSECTINTVLEQSSTRNWCVAVGGNTSSSSSSSSSIKWDFGPDMDMNPGALIIYGASPQDKTKGRRVSFGRVIRIGQTGIPMKRGSETLLPVQFKALLNSSGKYWSVEEPINLASCV